MARQADLLSVDDAQSRILSRFSRLPPESVALSEAYGRILAEPISSSLDIPPFANSSMDGFAVRASDTERASPEAPVRLPVSQHIPAGSREAESLNAGTCARIMTGAPVPDGSDAVVPFEDVTDEGDAIVLSSPVPSRACVRPAGQDVRAGQSLLPAGRGIGPAEIALLASVGVAEIPVTRRPVVAILSTGDELVPPGRELRRGQIYNSNTPMLEAAVRDAGGVAHVLTTASDDAAVIAAALLAADDAQLILTSGGASVGDFDHVKEVVGREGDLSFWRVRVRPGKPLLFGQVGAVPVVGLPGNPASAMVTFELFARPAIRSMLGAPLRRPTIRARAAEDFDNRGGRRSFLRVRLQFQDGEYRATASGGQDSAMVRPLAAANGLLIVPEETPLLRAGEWADVIVWRLPDDQ